MTKGAPFFSLNKAVSEASWGPSPGPCQCRSIRGSQNTELALRTLEPRCPGLNPSLTAPFIYHAGQVSWTALFSELIECVCLICQDYSRVKAAMPACSSCRAGVISHLWLPDRNTHVHPAPRAPLASPGCYPASLMKNNETWKIHCPFVTCKDISFTHPPDEPFF